MLFLPTSKAPRSSYKPKGTYCKQKPLSCVVSIHQCPSSRYRPPVELLSSPGPDACCDLSMLTVPTCVEICDWTKWHLQIKAAALCKHPPQTHFPVALNLRRRFLPSAASVTITVGGFHTFLCFSFRLVEPGRPFSCAVGGFLPLRAAVRSPTNTPLQVCVFAHVTAAGRGGFHEEEVSSCGRTSFLFTVRIWESPEKLFLFTSIWLNPKTNLIFGDYRLFFKSFLTR